MDNPSHYWSINGLKTIVTNLVYLTKNGESLNIIFIFQAIPEIDKRLNVEFELRKLARKEGRRYCDPVAVTYQSERMPEPIRSKVRIVEIKRWVGLGNPPTPHFC